MYKLTVMDSDEPIYDSVSNPIPEGEIYFHTHQILWKDDIQVGRICIDKKFAKLMLGENKPISIPRNKFQKLFMRDAQLVEMIFSAIEVSRVNLFPDRKCPLTLNGNYRFVRLYKKVDEKFTFYGDLVYKLK